MAKPPAETAKKAIKEPLKQDEILKNYAKDDPAAEESPKEAAPPPTTPPPPAAPPPPKIPESQKYVCRVRCWVPKYGIFEPGDIAEFTSDEFIPSHFDLVK